MLPSSFAAPLSSYIYFLLLFSVLHLPPLHLILLPLPSIHSVIHSFVHLLIHPLISLFPIIVFFVYRMCMRICICVYIFSIFCFNNLNECITYVKKRITPLRPAVSFHSLFRFYHNRSSFFLLPLLPDSPRPSSRVSLQRQDLHEQPQRGGVHRRHLLSHPRRRHQRGECCPLVVINRSVSPSVLLTGFVSASSLAAWGPWPSH